MKVIYSFYGLLLIVLSCAIDVKAGAWTRAKGGGYFQLSYSTIKGKTLYLDDRDEIFLNRIVSDRTLQAYLEYGLTDKMTFAAIVPFKFLQTHDAILPGGDFSDTLPAGQLNHPGNILLAGKHLLFRKKQWVLSGQLGLEMQTASYQPVTGLRSGYSAWGVAPSLLFGKSKGAFYATAEFGLIFRSHAYSIKWFAHMEAGYRFGQHFQLIAEVNTRQSFYNGTFEDGNARHTGLYTNNLEYLAYGLKFAWEFNEQWGISFATLGGISGNSVTKAPAFVAGFHYQWNKRQK